MKIGLIARLYNWIIKGCRKLAPWIVVLMTFAIPAYFAARGCLDMLQTEPLTVRVLLIMFGFCTITDIVILVASYRKKKSEKRDEDGENENNS